MPTIASSFALALAQLADARVLRILVKSILTTMALFAALGWAGWHALNWGLARFGLDDTHFAAAEGVRGLASILLLLVLGWLLWRIVAMAVMQFYADEVVAAVEARHYPAAAAKARDLPLPEQLCTAFGSAMRALVVNLIALPFAIILLVTGIGTAILFLIVNAFLIGRELQDMVWLRHAASPPARGRPPITGLQRFVLGAAVAALLIVPIANLLAPFLGAAAATHLIHRRKGRNDVA